MDIQNEASVGSKLLNAIKAQRSKNKYVLWGIYGLLGLLVMFILYQTFGFLIPSFGSADEINTETIENAENIGSE